MTQWGTSSAPSNYTTTAKFPISFAATPWLNIGIGIVAATDMKAKAVSCAQSEITTTAIKFRTALSDSPSVRWFSIGK